MDRKETLSNPLKSEDNMRKKYPPRAVYNKTAFGFKKVPGERLQEISYPLIALLDTALDLLDAGKTYREVTEWFNSVLLPEEGPMTHMGLKIIWYRERPDNPKIAERKKIVEKNKAQRKKSPLTRQEKLERTRRQKIANEKKKIAFAKKRMDKFADEIDQIKEYKNTNVVEIDYSSLSSSEDASQDGVNLEEINPAFKPNPGPQTEFLSAPQLEVLYGGAAGGEPQTRFSASFHGNVSK